MVVKYRIKGFSEYLFIDKKLYRNEYEVKMKNGNIQYRDKREIKQTNNNGVKGFILVKNGSRKFYGLNRLKYKLIKIN